MAKDIDEPFDTRWALRFLRLSRCQIKTNDGGHVTTRVTIAMIDSLEMVGMVVTRDSGGKVRKY